MLSSFGFAIGSLDFDLDPNRSCFRFALLSEEPKYWNPIIGNADYTEVDGTGFYRIIENNMRVNRSS